MAGGLVVVAQSAAHLIATVGFGVCDASDFAPCPSAFDLDHNNGIPDLVSTGVIAAAALGAAVLGTRRRPRQMAALALLRRSCSSSRSHDALHLEDTARSAYGLVWSGPSWRRRCSRSAWR